MSEVSLGDVARDLESQASELDQLTHAVAQAGSDGELHSGYVAANAARMNLEEARAHRTQAAIEEARERPQAAARHERAAVELEEESRGQLGRTREAITGFLGAVATHDEAAETVAGRAAETLRTTSQDQGEHALGIIGYVRTSLSNAGSAVSEAESTLPNGLPEPEQLNGPIDLLNNALTEANEASQNLPAASQSLREYAGMITTAGALYPYQTSGNQPPAGPSEPIPPPATPPAAPTPTLEPEPEPEQSPQPASTSTPEEASSATSDGSGTDSRASTLQQEGIVIGPDGTRYKSIRDFVESRWAADARSSQSPPEASENGSGSEPEPEPGPPDSPPESTSSTEGATPMPASNPPEVRSGSDKGSQSGHTPDGRSHNELINEAMIGYEDRLNLPEGVTTANPDAVPYQGGDPKKGPMHNAINDKLRCLTEELQNIDPRLSPDHLHPSGYRTPEQDEVVKSLKGDAKLKYQKIYDTKNGRMQDVSEAMYQTDQTTEYPNGLLTKPQHITNDINRFCGVATFQMLANGVTGDTIDETTIKQQFGHKGGAPPAMESMLNILHAPEVQDAYDVEFVRTATFDGMTLEKLGQAFDKIKQVDPDIDIQLAVNYKSPTSGVDKNAWHSAIITGVTADSITLLDPKKALNGGSGERTMSKREFSQRWGIAYGSGAYVISKRRR